MRNFAEQTPPDGAAASSILNCAFIYSLQLGILTSFLSQVWPLCDSQSFDYQVKVRKTKKNIYLKNRLIVVGYKNSKDRISEMDKLECYKLDWVRVV